MYKIYNLFVNYQWIIEQKYPWTNFLIKTYFWKVEFIFWCRSDIFNYHDFEILTVDLLKNIVEYDKYESVNVDVFKLNNLELEAIKYEIKGAELK